MAGRSESRVDEMAQPVYGPWLQQSPPIETTILASPGSIELHLSMQVTDEVQGAAAMNVAVEALRARLGPDVVGVEGESLEQAVGELLRARGWRIAFAESCTGGLATSRMTDVAGSSDYVDRSVVVYSNEAKTDLLGVPAALVAAHGAVSEPVVRAMAEGMLAQFARAGRRGDHRDCGTGRRQRREAGRHGLARRRAR